MKQETQQDLKKIEAQVEQHKGRVIDRMLEMVYDIKPEIHQNARLKN